MKDYNKYCKERFKKVKEELHKRFDKEVLQTKGGKTDRINAFNRIICFEKDNIAKSYDPYDPNSTSYNVEKNYFKESIINDFLRIKTDFPDDLINGFVEYEIPKQRKVHQGQYDAGRVDFYKFDPKFMNDASTEDILNMIVKYYAYEEFLKEDYKKLRSDFFGNEKQEVEIESDFIQIDKPKVKKRKNGDGFTVLNQGQTGILFRLLKDEGIIFNDTNYQPDTELAKAVQCLTGFSNHTLRREIGRSLHHHLKKNEDKKAVIEILKKLLRELEKSS